MQDQTRSSRDKWFKRRDVISRGSAKTPCPFSLFGSRFGTSRLWYVRAVKAARKEPYFIYMCSWIPVQREKKRVKRVARTRGRKRQRKGETAAWNGWNGTSTRRTYANVQRTTCRCVDIQLLYFLLARARLFLHDAHSASPLIPLIV